MQQGGSLNPHTRGLSLVCLGLIFVEGIIALLWSFTQPVDPDSAFVLGYSPVRWALASVIFLSSGLAGALWLDLLRGVERPWWRKVAYPAVFPTMLASASLGLLAADHTVLMLLGSIDHSAVRAIFNRLLPLGAFLGLAALQILLASAPAVTKRYIPDRQVTRVAGLALAGLAVTSGVIIVTRLGLEPVSNGWYEYGVPLVHQQLLYLFFGALLALLAGLALSGRLAFIRRAAWIGDASLILAVWLAAVLLWSSMPVPNSWLTPRPYPPNFEIYPHSDALSYDAAAQGTLLGAAWARGEIHYKPLYVGILTLLRAAAGQDYTRVIRLQTLLLALFPVFLYLLGRGLHSRMAGGLAALAAILREYNQLSVGSLTTLSNSKLMLSELPTALGISALLVVLVVWLRPAWEAGRGSMQPGRVMTRPDMAILAGGLIGLISQIRLQVILFLPVLAAFLFLYYRKHWRVWLAATGLVCLGFCLSAAPLVARNWAASGTLALEKPGYFERTLSYSYNPLEDQGETTGSPIPGQTGQGLVRTAELALHHFAHNTVSAFLVLPSGLGSGSAWTQGFQLKKLFWLDYRAAVRLPSAAWMLFNLAMVAVGAAALWQRGRWLSLLPALFFAAYNASSALGGFSGQRFILPADWVGYFYWMAGLAWLAPALLGLLGWNTKARLPFWTQPVPSGAVKLPTSRLRWQKTAAAAGFLLLAGGLLPLEEMLIPVRYPALSASQAQTELLRLAEERLPEPQLRELEALLAQPDSQVLHGVALYPRAFGSLEEEAGLLRYTGERTYPLLAFVYIGSDQLWVLQPVDRLANAALPHGAEVLVAGTRSEESFRAFATARFDQGQILFFETSH